MFRLGEQSTPKKVLYVPHFPFLKENNVRQGFLEDSKYEKLVEGAALWFRTLVECGASIGWRHEELLSLQVRQVDLKHRTLRLEPGTTKNGDGREAPITEVMRQLLAACVAGKKPDDAVLFDLLLVWAPDEGVRHHILVDNPAILYDYPKSA